MLESRANSDSLVRFLALCGIAAPVVFATLVTVAGFIYDGYSHVAQAVSELGGDGAQQPLLQNINFFLAGALFIAFALGLHRGIGGGKGSALGPVLVAVFGVSSGLANALLPCDPGCEFQSFTGTMHNLTGLGGFIAAIGGMWVISRRLQRDPLWRGLSRFSSMAAVAALVSLVLWIGVAKAAEVDTVNGLLQRLYILTWFAWAEVMALRLFWVSRRPVTQASK